MGFEWIPALAVAAVGGCIDIRRGIIPDWFSLGACLGGMLWHFGEGGAGGLLHSAAGAFLTSTLFLIPFLLGGVGGGDFKLVLAVGAFLGPWNGLRAALATGFAGGIFSVLVLIWANSFLLRWIPFCWKRTWRRRYRERIRRLNWGSIYYGPVIAAGTAWSIFIR